MTEENGAASDPREALKLKQPEPELSPEQPWQDDALDRANIAERLTTLIRGQRDPFVISIDGPWGSGKTFLLKRWQSICQESQMWQDRRLGTGPEMSGTFLMTGSGKHAEQWRRVWQLRGHFECKT